MTVLVAVQDRAGARAVIRAAAQEARLRQAKLVALAVYSADGAVAAPAARPAGGALRTADEARARAEDVLRDATLDALGPEAAQVELLRLACFMPANEGSGRGYPRLARKRGQAPDDNSNFQEVA